jgi:hypothetical protein
METATVGAEAATPKADVAAGPAAQTAPKENRAKISVTKDETEYLRIIRKI